MLPQQSWIVFDDLSSVIFVEVKSQSLGRCQNLGNCNFVTQITWSWRLYWLHYTMRRFHEIFCFRVNRYLRVSTRINEKFPATKYTEIPASKLTNLSSSYQILSQVVVVSPRGPIIHCWRIFNLFSVNFFFRMPQSLSASPSNFRHIELTSNLFQNIWRPYRISIKKALISLKMITIVAWYFLQNRLISTKFLYHVWKISCFVFIWAWAFLECWQVK